MGALGLILFGNFYRYYFFGKIQAQWNKITPAAEREQKAIDDKRSHQLEAVCKLS
jgi:hypothetical protein